MGHHRPRYLFARILLTLTLGLVFVCGPLPPGPARAAAPLVVGVKEAPPFAFKTGNSEWDGISIRLWKDMAHQLDLAYRFEERDLKGLLQGLQDKSLDAAVAALTITGEREKKFDFSHPFHTASLGIAAIKAKKRPWTAVINSIFSPEFLEVILTLSLLLLAVGVLIWLVERKKNHEQFGGSVLSGIGSGFWWSAVTMTTVGYGDKAPRTLAGRVIGLIWMFMAIITISSFTAAITSTLTLSRFQSLVSSPKDLHRVAVGTLPHSTAAAFLEESRIDFQGFDTLTRALGALASEEIAAVVYDAPMLRYLINGDPALSERIHLIPSGFSRQQYGIGLVAGSPIRERINQLIPALTSSRDWEDLLTEFLGSSR